MKENKFIAETIHSLTHKGKHDVAISEYRFIKDVYCWVVWTSNNEGNELFKVVPIQMSVKGMVKTLKCQSWIYP